MLRFDFPRAPTGLFFTAVLALILTGALDAGAPGEAETGGGKNNPGEDKARREPPPPYNWGAFPGEIRRNLKGGKVIKEQPGANLQVTRDELSYVYYFFREEKPGRILLKKEIVDGKPRMVLANIIPEYQVPAEEARLYAVSITMPGILFNKSRRKEILALFLPEASEEFNKTDSSFDIKRGDTLLRVFYEKYRGQTYLIRVVFNSVRLSQERNEHIKLRLKREEQNLRVRLKQANENLKREEERKSGPKKNGPENGAGNSKNNQPEFPSVNLRRKPNAEKKPVVVDGTGVPPRESSPGPRVRGRGATRLVPIFSR